jgi:hypothetical protein
LAYPIVPHRMLRIYERIFSSILVFKELSNLNCTNSLLSCLKRFLVFGPYLYYYGHHF